MDLTGKVLVEGRDQVTQQNNILLKVNRLDLWEQFLKSGLDPM